MTTVNSIAFPSTRTGLPPKVVAFPRAVPANVAHRVALETAIKLGEDMSFRIFDGLDL